MYTYQSRIRYSEIDEGGTLRLEALLDYFQDCSTFQSEDLGLGVDYLKSINRVWVLSSWQIVVERYPALCETVSVGTLPYDFKGFIGYRNFVMLDREGSFIARANSIWSLLDTQTNRPVRPEADMMKKYPLEPWVEMEYASRRIVIPEGVVAGDPVPIKNHHLDTNHHVNNGQFIKIAMDCLGSSFRVKQLRAEYKKQVLLGDVLTPYTAATEDGKYVIALKNAENVVCCVVELEEERERS